MKKIISILFYVLLAVLLIVNAFTLSMKSDVIKSSVVNRLIDSSGVYNTIYQEFEKEGRKKAELVVADNGLNPELSEWMWNNISEVFTQNYVENLTRINMEAIVGYVLGERDELATFNLIPKYAELMDVTADNLDSDVIAEVLEISDENLIKALDLLDEKAGYEKIKKQAVKIIFESTDKIKAPFLATTTEQLLGVVGQEKQLENIHDARLEVQKFRRYVSGLLIVTIVLLLALLISGITKINRSLNRLWVTFAISGTIVLISGLAIGFFEINVIQFINENIMNIGLKSNQSAIADVLYIVAYSSMKIGVVYILIAAVFLIATFVFKKENKKIYSNKGFYN